MLNVTKKMHINKHGVPAECRAEKTACRLGAHFSSQEEAEAYLEKEHAGDASPLSKKTENSEKKGLVLSDVDGTIVKGSLVLGHAVWLAEKGVRPDLYGDIPQRWKADPKNEAIINELGGAYSASLEGVSYEESGTDAYIDEFIENRDNMYSTIDRLQELRDQGHRVVLISGSPDHMIQRVAAKFGFEGVGSEYEIEGEVFTGKVTRPMYGSSGKKDYIANMEIGKNVRVIGFGDTASDVPIFDVSHHSVLVDPHPETYEKLSGKIDEVIYE